MGLRGVLWYCEVCLVGRGVAFAYVQSATKVCSLGRFCGSVVVWHVRCSRCGVVCCVIGCLCGCIWHRASFLSMGVTVVVGSLLAHLKLAVSVN